MIKLVYNKIYPYLGVGGLEITKHLSFVTDFQEVSALVFQIIISLLTCSKLILDIINKNKKM